MENYKMVAQWAATIKIDEALNELQMLKLKYPWLKCEKSLLLLQKLAEELPDMLKIIKLQERENAIHRKYIELNRMADEAIVNSIAQKFNLEI